MLPPIPGVLGLASRRLRALMGLAPELATPHGLVPADELLHAREIDNGQPADRPTMPDRRGWRVLILSAGIGAGHVRAAEAVRGAILDIEPGATVRHVDILNLTNRAYKFINARLYFTIAQRWPHLLASMYDRLDGDRQTAEETYRDRFRIAIDRWNMAGLTRLVCDEPWDLIISTHFTPSAIVGQMKAAGRLSTPMAVVTTDYDVHRIWITPHCEMFFAASEESAANIIDRGVNPAAVHVTGIPVVKPFADPTSRPVLREALGLGTDRPVVLQLAGGFGVGPIEQIHRAILQIRRPLDIVTVTGRNESAAKMLGETPLPGQHRRRILGFTDRMHEWLGAADVVVSKAGGLTVSESLATGTAMVIVDPIPGQETRNADYVLENGAGIKVNNLSAFAHKVGSLLADRPRLEAMQASARRIARPGAARDVAELAMSAVSPRRRASLTTTDSRDGMPAPLRRLHDPVA